MRRLIVLPLIIIGLVVKSQTTDTIAFQYKSTTDNMMMLDKKLTIGGYAQIDYNQPIDKDLHKNGTLDVHRMVMLFGYKFNNRTQFFTEIEYEHVSEVYVEQAFLDYKINNFIHFRGGLMLIPMGIVNEYHEPPTYNGVERPLVDKYIVPTTWRELGVGITGNIPLATLKYQVYIVNGFKSDDPDNYLSGKNGLRKGRQKGAESFTSSPNLSLKLDYYGLPGLNLGLAGYFGNTQSSAYNNLDKNDAQAKAAADSSIVGVAMFGFDARYQIKGLQLRGQFNYTNLSNTEQYNALTGSDVGSAMIGYYIEAGYNVFQAVKKIESQLIPFVRFEKYDTQHKVSEGTNKNKAYNNEIITAGLGWKITPGVALKADMQFIKSAEADKYANTFNAGIGIMF